MQAGTLSGADVQTFTSRVLVNGVQRPVLSYSLDGELTGDLPDQVVATASVMQGQGSVTWADSDDVTDGGKNPWNPSTGWIPQQGDRVEIFEGDNATEWVVFRGLIDQTSGDIGGGCTSSIIDGYDRFSATVALPALLAMMPPLEVAGAYRRIALTPRFYVDTAFRRAGFNTTPARQASCVLDVPFQGSAHALLGSVQSCARDSVSDQSPVMWDGPDFMAMSDFTAYYLPSASRPASDPVQVTLLRGAGQTGFGKVRLHHGSTVLELRSTGGGAAVLVGSTVICTIAVTGNPVIQCLVKNGIVTLKASSGQSNTGTTTFGGTVTLDRVQVVSDVNSRVAGVQVSYPNPATNQEFASLAHVPSARIRPGAMHGLIPAARSYELTSCADLLTEISKSLLWAIWIDETGKAQAAASDVLRGQASSQTITTLDDVRTLSWQSNLLGVRSTVQGAYEAPVISLRRDYSVPLWEATSSVSLGADEAHEQLIEPGGDIDWIMPDITVGVFGLINLAEPNAGIGSLGGGVYTDGVSEQWASLAGVDKLDFTVARKSSSQWQVKAAAKGIQPGYRVELRTLSENFQGSTALWPYWWGKELPIVRGKGKSEWASRERPIVNAGSLGPALTHNAGIWATGHLEENESTNVDALVAFIVGQVSSPAATVPSVKVGYDPRRQRGDVITLSSPTFMGVTLRCLVVGIQSAAGTSGYTQSLSVRVISATTTYTTYADFAEAWGNVADYDSFAAAWGAIATYANFNTDPLRGTN